MRISFAIVLLLLCGLASFGGGAAWTAWTEHRTAERAQREAALREEAIAAIRSDPVACSRGLPAAANLCAALVRYDTAAQAVALWAEPADRATVTQTLATVRDSAIKTDAPAWVPSTLWAEEAVLRRARALEAALETLKTKPDGYEKSALSTKLSDILKEKLLRDSATP